MEEAHTKEKVEREEERKKPEKARPAQPLEMIHRECPLPILDRIIFEMRSLHGLEPFQVFYKRRVVVVLTDARVP